ncbi:unnamed protein product [Protopolystoma xenopodis]|uniref:Helicase-associated domain-containing protein n=1 Tax=Protopolystoma xenopodis TaxID=117903 RepID=A0A3S5BTD1_9PLAT|nr:unnamed protein product [Protopolystoma xenopodis]
MVLAHGALVEHDIPDDEDNADSRSRTRSRSRRSTIDQLVITPLGRLLSDLPVDLAIGRMLIMASLFRCSEPVLTLAAGMAVPSPLSSITSLRTSSEASGNLQQTRLQRAEALEAYESDNGDPFTVSNIFDEWIMVLLFLLDPFLFPALEWFLQNLH